MPLIDMPLEELKKYQGISPKPDDFDEYWDRAITEMKSVDPEVKFEKSNFISPGAECYDMYFTGVKGARIYAKHIRPEKITEKIPAILLFHGYSGNSGDWTHWLKYILAGFAVFVMDVRGQGGKSEDVGGVKGNTFGGHIIRGLDEENPDKLLFRDIFLDTAELANIAMNMDFIDENKIYAQGGSQGGALTIACAALEPRVAKIAPVYPFLSDYKRVFEMDMAERAYRELKDYFRNFDPLHRREDEIFTKLGYIDLQHLADRIKAKTLFTTALMDVVCPASTQFAIYNKLTCEKTHIIYPDFGHEGIPMVEDNVYMFLTRDELI